ncbi:hydroxyethylthiazole kinase [Caldanaerobacter sp.]|uniref:hydroxyethylthiazole kinase n=1 Tax=Caldanaerobacter sp. TaxID=2930036 RepID=UPI003C709189
MGSELLKLLRDKKPLIHHITNVVTVNDCANVTLAIGALPVMAYAHEEVEEMVKNANALVLNIGTLSVEEVNTMIKAGKAANQYGVPVILDPVGAGATSLRTKSAKRIIEEVRVSVIKGNSAEISTLSGRTGKIRGVEAVEEEEDISDIAYDLAVKCGCVVAVSGKVDVITDGKKIAYVKNGHPMMGTITGTGCMLTSVVASFCAVAEDHFEGTLEAFIAFGVAGEKAAQNPKVKGPGSFKVAFFDEIYNLTSEIMESGRKIDLIVKG